MHGVHHNMLSAGTAMLAGLGLPFQKFLTAHRVHMIEHTTMTHAAVHAAKLKDKPASGDAYKKQTTWVICCLRVAEPPAPLIKPQLCKAWEA